MELQIVPSPGCVLCVRLAQLFEKSTTPRLLASVGHKQGADVGGRVTPGILRRVTASPIAATVVASLLGAPVELAVSHGGYAGAGARQFRSYILFRTHI